MVSFVVPCFNNASTLTETIRSIWSGGGRSSYEILVVDDGSSPALSASDLPSEEGLPPVTLISLPENIGKSRACNKGFEQTKGDVVVVLDADDTLVSNWADVMDCLREQWPQDSPLAFAWAETDKGELTGKGSGLYSREQFLNNDAAGEYLPIFKGEAARTLGYLTPGCRHICGALSYARLLEQGPLYIHSEIIRYYRTESPGSLSNKAFTPAKAADLHICFRAVREYVEGYNRQNGIGRSSYLSKICLKEVGYLAWSGKRFDAVRRLLSNGRMMHVRDFVFAFLQCGCR